MIMNSYSNLKTLSLKMKKTDDTIKVETVDEKKKDTGYQGKQQQRYMRK